MSSPSLSSSPSHSRLLGSSSLPSRSSLDSHFSHFPQHHQNQSSRQASTPTPTLHGTSPRAVQLHHTPPLGQRTTTRQAHFRSSISMEPYALTGFDAYGEKFYDDTVGNYDKVNRRQVLTDVEYTVTSLSWLRESLHQVCQPDGGDRYLNNEDVMIPRIIVPGLGFADNMYKVEIGRVALPVPEDAFMDPNEAHPQDQPVAIYITSHLFDLGLAKSPYPVNVFIGICAKELNVGSALSPTAWLWTHTVDVEFSKDVDWLEVVLPLFEIMERPSAVSADGLTFAVQVSSKCQPRPRRHPTHPPEYPADIQEGMASLVDDHTGDVEFIVLEHCAVDEQGELVPDHGQASQRLSRKRVIKAHSSMLKSRSEYFRALLAGGFAESDTARPPDESSTKVTKIVVDDVPFDTMFWILKFIYANIVSFRHEDDVRMVMDRDMLHQRSVRHMLENEAMGSWEYRQLPSEGDVPEDELSEMDMRDRDDDARTVKSVSSVGTSVSQRAPPPGGARGSVTLPTASFAAKSRDRAVSSAGSAISKASSISSAESKISTGTASSATPRAVGPPRTPNRPPAGPVPAPGGSTAGSAGANTKTSPVKLPPSTRSFPLPLRHLPPPDPHSHPAAPPLPASALSTYMAAHRYQLGALTELAREQILYRLTIENCVPTLLSTYPYKELHADILNWIMDRFSLVKSSEEFAQCVREVSQGVWGETGGQVLLGLFARF